MIQVLAFVDPNDKMTLERLAQRDLPLVLHHRWPDFRDALSRQAADVALVGLRGRSVGDSRALPAGESFAAELRAIPCPLVLLCDESLHTLRFAFRLANRTATELAIIRPDGSPDGVEDAIDAASTALAGQRVYAGLVRARPALRKSPPLDRLVQHVLLRPEHFSDESRALRDRRISPTTANQWLRRAGVQPLRVLRRAARAAAAVSLARTHGLTLKQLAARLGCSEDTVQRAIAQVRGWSREGEASAASEVEIIDGAIQACLLVPSHVGAIEAKRAAKV